MHTETLQQFYERTKQPMPAELASQANVSHFNVKQRTCLNRMTPYNRRDYYKICLIVGQGVHLAGDQETPIEGAGIIFSNPGYHRPTRPFPKRNRASTAFLTTLFY
jgi:AraC family transcriptional activator of pobA